MKTKLTLTDCFKYPNAKIRGYEKGRCVVEYRDIKEFLYLKFSCSYRNIDIHERLSKCKLQLRTLDSLTEQEKNDLLDIALKDKCLKVLSAKDYSHGNFDNDLFQLDIKRTDYLRSISLDIDGLEQSGKAVYE